MAVRDSRTATTLATVRRCLTRAATAAITTRWVHTIGSWIGSAVSHSRLAETAECGQQICRASWLSRWLTAETGSNIVVIDLRESLIVSSIIAVLDIVIDLFADGWRQARSGQLFVRIAAALRDRPIQIASSVAFVAVAANLFIGIGFATPTTNTIGVKLIVVALALAGTRVTVSGETLADSRIAAIINMLLEPPEPADSPRNAADRNTSIGSERREE